LPTATLIEALALAKIAFASVETVPVTVADQVEVALLL
jgi:hypothetical protein